MSSPPWSSVDSTPTAPTPDYPSEDPNQNKQGSQIGGAAVAGGLAGLILSGPLLGIAGAGGAAYLASQKGEAGDAARATGDVVLAAGEKAKEIDREHRIVDKTWDAAHVTAVKAREIDERHHVVDKTKDAAHATALAAKDFDERHHVVDKTKRAAGATVQAAKDFDQRHKVVERTSKGIASASYWIANQLRGGKKEEDDKKW